MTPSQFNAIKPDEQWIQEYSKQRYNRLCDTLAEYIEAEEGIDLFKRDFFAAIKELKKPMEQQVDVLDKMEDLLIHDVSC